VPIFVYRCDCGHRFERLVPRDAEPPACPLCEGSTRKIPAGPSLARGASPGARTPGPSGSVPIQWQGVVSGGPEKMQREIQFRRRLEAKGREGIQVPGGPTRPSPEPGGAARQATPSTD
jgi:putative FmdB family regulatory protein